MPSVTIEIKKLVLILWILLPAIVAGQTESIVIEWNEDPGQLSFPHALYEDQHNSLPYFTRKIDWEDLGKIPLFDVDVTASTLLGESDLGNATPQPLLNRPETEFQLVGESDAPYVLLKLFPFIRNDQGQVERIDAFDLQLEWEMALAPLKSLKTASWSEHSVLATGNWYRVSVEKEGIHKLTYEELKEIGLNNPANVRVYGTGARLLPENFAEGHVDDLSPAALYMEKGSDGTFGPGDHILFYAEGPVGWSYNEEEQFFIPQLHHHSLKGYYFLTDSYEAATPLPEALLSSENPDNTVIRYDYRAHFEEETYNLIKSGKEWYGDLFSVNLEYHYPFHIPGPSAGEPLRARVVTAARSGSTSYFSVSGNGTFLGNISIRATDLSAYTYTFAFENPGIFEVIPQSEDLTLTIEYDRPDSDSYGWLNNISLNGRCDLDMNSDDQLVFRDIRSTGPGSITMFRLGVSGNPVIWDITNPLGALRVPYSLSGQEATFTLETPSLREFIAFNPQGSFPTPGYSEEGLGVVENQNLHGLEHPDMIILTPALFLEQARKLAQHRRDHDELDVAVVLQQQVFNEFSSGTPDVTAIRNFMKMFYERSGGTGSNCRYLLLFGDGSYDNRSRPGKNGNPNLILTYQSDNSLEPTRSFVSDDYYGILETNAGMHDGDLQIGIGRLPASTVDEAIDLVEKIISYGDKTNQGDWRNQICFIGDDEDGNLHMRQADELARNVEEKYPSYSINKIYLDAYPQKKTSTGFRYPDVNTAITNQVNRGALIVNYTGHGGTGGLAHEQIVTYNDILSWSNQDMLPLFMTATCEFSRYDEYDLTVDQEITSAGEEVLLNNEGGGIGLFTTTRLVYAGPNHELNEKFYEVVFEKDGNHENYRLGDVIVYSKNNSRDGVNKRNFTLLGDPSLRLVYPQHRVVTDSINGASVLSDKDTLSAFDWVTVAGHLETREGATMEDFNGTVYPMVFDKEKNVETLANDHSSPFNFKARNNILYSGKATVTNGKFSFGFFVPKDINYSYGPGKISYYSNNQQLDAHGSWEQFSVGGLGQENTSDTESPVIDLFMNDSFFMPGGITDPDPTLLIYASDNFGINTTGNGIGHDLTATLDGNRINAIILNEFFQANTNSFNSGVIRYPYHNLEEGRHEITVKIWDIHNNSAESGIEFLVVDSEEMLIEKLWNYPNPFLENTLFNIEHNRPDREMRLKITIYNLKGEMVRTLEEEVFSPGYRLEPASWDGTSAGGARLGGGIYLYKVILSTDDGEMATESGKMILLQ